MEYYSATKNNKITPFAGKWVEIEIIMFSEIGQAQKATYYMFLLMCGI
jgi:hypothetical protein